MRNFITGANQADAIMFFGRWRGAPLQEYADIRTRRRQGTPAANCAGGTLEEARSIEVGAIFQLWTYSRDF